MPVVLSNLARALSVEEPGPTTSPPALACHEKSPRKKVDDDAVPVVPKAPTETAPGAKLILSAGEYPTYESAIIQRPPELKRCSLPNYQRSQLP